MNKQEIIAQIYNDLTNTVVPKISGGLSISKEYFTDLFGRYIHYLLIIDVAELVFSIIATLFFITIAIYVIRLYLKNKEDAILAALFPICLLLIPSILGVYIKAKSVLKDIYVPEVRVYEEIMNYKNK